MDSGYQNIYDKLLAPIAACDLEESARRLGLEYSNGTARVRFLGRDFEISSSGVIPVDGRPVDVNFLSVLLYYALSKGNVEPEYSFAPLMRLTGTIEGRNSQDAKPLFYALHREFEGDTAKLAEAAGKLGMRTVESPDQYCHIWEMELLPKMPARIVYYEPDEEFPADIQLMLDNTAPKYMEFECLAFMCGCLVSALIDAARENAAK